MAALLDSWKCLAKQFQAFGDRRLIVFHAFKLQRNVATVIVLAQNLAYPLVVEIQRIPLAAPIIGFGLNKDGPRRDLLQSLIRVFEKVACVGCDLQSW